jgi:hypothetical protein
MNEAGKPGCPRLQIANTGSTRGEAKVIVLVAVEVPFKVMMSPTVLGEAVTVPPIKELGGAHTPVLLLITVLL